MRVFLLVCGSSLCLLIVGCAHPRVYAIDQVTMPPHLESRVAAAPGLHTSGIVIAECVIKTNGTVGSVRIVRSHDAETDRATVNALKQARFTPAQLAGKPVPVRLLFTMNFSS
jgi:TonB family protein